MEHVAAFGLVAHKEGRCPGRLEHHVEELLLERGTYGGRGAVAEAALERDELPVDDALIVALALSVVALPSVVTLKSRGLQWLLSESSNKSIWLT